MTRQHSIAEATPETPIVPHLSQPAGRRTSCALGEVLLEAAHAALDRRDPRLERPLRIAPRRSGAAGAAPRAKLVVPVLGDAGAQGLPLLASESRRARSFSASRRQ